MIQNNTTLNDPLYITELGELEPPLFSLENCEDSAILAFTNSIVGAAWLYKIVVYNEPFGQESLINPIHNFSSGTLNYQIIYETPDNEVSEIFDSLEYESHTLEVSLFSYTTDPNDSQGNSSNPKPLVHLEMDGGSEGYTLFLDGKNVTNDVNDRLIWMEYVGDNVEQMFVLQDNQDINCLSSEAITIPYFVLPPVFEPNAIYNGEDEAILLL